MKKIEILRLIEANRKIKVNKSLLSITCDKLFQSIIIDREYWFPKIEGLEKEFEVLSEEVQSTLDETNECKKIICSANCEHEIRLKHYGVFGGYSTCILCGESISPDNCVSWEESINRNKYCVDLIAKYQDDEDYNLVENGYTEEQIFEIILGILENKTEEEEIDLVQEFKKLNLQRCTIKEEKKVLENYILIVSGSNKQYIDEETYILKKCTKIGVDFLKYFSGLLNTKIELIDNCDIFESNHLKNEDNRNLKFTDYCTIEELKKILNHQRNIPFKIIIDLSDLYEYKIKNYSISKETVSLKLNEFFPNSKIIKIKDLSRESLEKLSYFLKFYKTEEKLYAYQNNNYYYLDENEIKSKNFEETCLEIKKTLKRQIY